MDMPLNKVLIPSYQGTTPLVRQHERETSMLERSSSTVPLVAEPQPLSNSGVPSLQDNPDVRRLKDEGKLTPEVLQQLNVLATEPLAHGIDRAELLSNAVAEIADPSSIRQGDRDTCAATVVESQLAESRPAEYLRLLAGLASPGGQVRLNNGDGLKRDANWSIPSGRSLVGNLMQPAFMQYATGSYENRTDTRRIEAGRAKGMYADEQVKLETAVDGTPTLSVYGNGPEVAAALMVATAQGQTVPAILTARDPKTGEVRAHSVLIEMVRDGKVMYLDPRGRRMQAFLSVFMARVQSTDLPKQVVTPSLLRASCRHGRGALAGDSMWGRFMGAVSSAAQVVHDHVIQPASHAADAVAEAVVGGAQAIGQAVVGSAQALGNGAVAVGRAVWDGGAAAAHWVLDRRDLVNTVAFVCAFIPGLQVVTLAIAAAQALIAVADIVKGYQDHDWREGLTGVIELAGAVTTALGGAYLSKMLGKTADVASKVVGGVARLAKGGTELLDAFNGQLDTTTRIGRSLAMVADFIGGPVDALGTQASQVSGTLSAVASRASSDYDQAIAIVQALTAKEPMRVGRGLGIAQRLLMLGGDLNSTYFNRSNLNFKPEDEKGKAETYAFRSVAGYAGALEALDDRIEAQDLMRNLPGDAAIAATLGEHVVLDMANDWQPDVPAAAQQGKDVADRFRRSADYFHDADTLTQSDQMASARALQGLVQKGAADTHFDWGIVPGVRPILGAYLWGESQSRRVAKWADDTAVAHGWKSGGANP